MRVARQGDARHPSLNAPATTIGRARPPTRSKAMVVPSTERTVSVIARSIA
jgi:hypothetical protein